MEISYQKISDQLDEWTKETFGDSFSFRQYQKEVAIGVILTFLTDEKKYYIAECPTGFGKSFMAFAIAGVLSTYYDKTGYILCSDISLTKQYSRDLEQYLPWWGNLIGQKNYLCTLNGLNFNLGTCKLEGIKSYTEIEAKYPDCSYTCEYISNRKKAALAPVTVCTYQWWLIQQNYVKRFLGEGAPFKTRDFVICDEAHNMLDIVQNQFSPRLGKEDITKIFNVIDSYGPYNDHIKSNIKGRIQKCRNVIFDEDDNDKVFIALKNYFAEIENLKFITKATKTAFGERIKKGEILDKTDRTILSNCNFIEDYSRKFADFIGAIEEIGTKYIVKNDSDKDKGILVFNCINESYLMNSVFHNNCNKGLFMSATIGDPDVFAKDLNISKDNYTYANGIPSPFDFSKSPIYYLSRYRLNFKTKDWVFPELLRLTETIIRKYPDMHGIIQTGNYEFSAKILEKIDPELQQRLIAYTDSQSKQEILNMFSTQSSDKILIGPSLIEGIDLKDDLCRFIIMFKIPFPSLADKYIKTKMEFDETWYANKTVISVLQGVGRGVRNENDYCDTYILDGTFDRLLYGHPNMFTRDFMNRIVYINENELIENKLM